MSVVILVAHRYHEHPKGRWADPIQNTRPDRPRHPGRVLGATPAGGQLSPKVPWWLRDAALQFSVFLRQQGMPTDVTAIHREHVEALVSHLLDKAHRIDRRHPLQRAAATVPLAHRGW